MFGEITIYWFYLFSLLSIWFIKHFLKNSFDFETYLAVLNACFCVIWGLIRAKDATIYIPHSFGYYLYCLYSERDKNLYTNLLEVYNNFNIVSWLMLGYLFFVAKKFRRSFLFSLIVAIGSILSQFAVLFMLIWTKNLDNPVFENYTSLKYYFLFDIDIFYGFLIFQLYVYLWYRIYKNQSQSTENQNFVKILFATIGFFIIFYSILR